MRILALLLALPALSHAGPIGLDAGITWHGEQIAAAAKGSRAFVRIPLVHRAKGDAQAPPWYIGTTPKSAEGRPMWIAPVFSKYAADLPKKVPPGGMIVQAEGFYTGKTKEFVWTAKDGASKRYTMGEFQVQRWRPQRATDKFVIHTLLDGAEAQAPIEPLKDDRRWLVIAHTLDLRSKACTRGAKIRRKRLIEKGFKQTEIIDSRQAPMLGCCSKSVLIGRFETRVKARVRAHEARQKGVTVYVRKGW